MVLFNFLGYGQIAEFLIEKGANVNVRKNGMTALMWASIRGKNAILHTL